MRVLRRSQLALALAGADGDVDAPPDPLLLAAFSPDDFSPDDLPSPDGLASPELSDFLAEPALALSSVPALLAAEPGLP